MSAGRFISKASIRIVVSVVYSNCLVSEFGSYDWVELALV